MLKAFGVAALLGATYAQNTSLPTVDLGYEVYRATGFNDTGGFYNFSNIRYAQAPVDNLRFAPPKSPLQNRAAINDGSTGRVCYHANPAWEQGASNVLIALLTGQPLPTQKYVPPGANSSSPVLPADPQESEDCLFLDVFVPKDVLSQAGNCSGAAVLVWIYGGGFTNGNKNENPAGLLAASGAVSGNSSANIIYVAMNYRMGAFGFQAGPSYLAEGGTANLGLLDQRFALEWVQQYIHLFGGDPNRVTVVGESAGGGSIMHHITAYGGTRGPVPFQQAIPQSPGWQPVQNNAQEEDTYQTFLNLTGAASLAELRALPSETLRRANFQQIAYDSPWGAFGYTVVVDGDYVPQQPGQLLAQGKFDQSLKVMVGHNTNEGAFFAPASIMSEQDIQDQLRSAYPYAPQKSVDYITKVLYPPVFDGTYGYTNYFQRTALLIAESIFTCNTEYLALGFKNQTYSYLFDVPPAFHGFDTYYTYYTGGALSDSPLGVTNRTVAIALQEYIASFADNGVPYADGVPMFQMYGPNANVLDLGIKDIMEVHDTNANARCAWWQKALY